jgi:hypothetical protein
MKNKFAIVFLVLTMLIIAVGSAAGEIRESGRPGKTAISLGIVSYQGLGIEARFKYNFYAEPLFETNNLSLEFFASLSSQGSTYFMEVGGEGEYNFTPHKNYAIYLGLGAGYTGSSVGVITWVPMTGFAFLSQGWEYFFSSNMSVDIKIKEVLTGPATYTGGAISLRYYW